MTATIRCPHCQLNQFVSEKCRRCRKTMVVEVPIVDMPVVVVKPEEVFSVSKRIVAIRYEKHLSQSQLARRVPCQRTYISKAESGRISPTFDSIERIAKGLGVPVLEIIDKHRDRRKIVASDPFLMQLAPFIKQLTEDQRNEVLATVKSFK